MKREKMIEEMAKIIKKTYEKHGVFNPKWFAEAIYDKIFSDGAVVLTREELAEERRRAVLYEKALIGKAMQEQILQDLNVAILNKQRLICDSYEEVFNVVDVTDIEEIFNDFVISTEEEQWR